MTTDSMLNNSIKFGIENKKNSNCTIAVSYPIPQIDVQADLKKFLTHASLSIKTMSSAYYKETPYLEVSEIEQIKTVLSNYKSDADYIEALKKSLVVDLTAFQAKIRDNHVQKLAAIIKERNLCKKQITVLDLEKHKLIMERLSKIAWPYDSKTKEYDCQIVALQNKLVKCEQQIETLQNAKPTANEKDILIYQMHLKEKYAKIGM